MEAQFLDVDDVLKITRGHKYQSHQYIDGALMQFGYLKMGFIIGVAHVVVHVYDSVIMWVMVVVWFHFYHMFSL
jgi:uncharacterized protein (DUF983 family)